MYRGNTQGIRTNYMYFIILHTTLCESSSKEVVKKSYDFWSFVCNNIDEGGQRSHCLQLISAREAIAHNYVGNAAWDLSIIFM